MAPRRGKKGAKRPVRKGRKMGPRMRSDVASCTDNIGFFSALPNTVYTLSNAALTNSQRAVSIAKAYQFYRIAKVEVKWKLYADTFASAVAGNTVPTLYYKIDKANTFPNNTTLANLKSAGAKPRRLDDKNLSVSWVPAVHLGSDDGNAGGPSTVAETAAVVKNSPWITTNANAGGAGPWVPNSVDHRGLIFAVEQLTAPGSGTGVCSCEVIVHYEFKAPLWTTGTSDPSVHEVNLDTMEIIEPTLPTA